ncbi:hypothetical protein [Mucilaginibacter lappiensis]|uniref:Uncharacterized protein n=1 Tax=Mucilaginibacter lappiensis TaxID=354630 RepID=A0A841JSS5_9SPHI|nr:hypothetical protein [Mucilaginibacter lappiensis]MBB6131335.1 hypothetical protein [Mucilaginibacter lappiensis]
MKSAFKNNLQALAINAIAGILIAFICGFNPVYGAVGANTLMLVFAFVKTLYTGKPIMQAGRLYAGLFKEIWIGKLMEKFYPDDSWLVRSVDMTAFVENNTINLADAGVDPDVLVNNTTYPIPLAERTDNPIALPLDYFDTVNTVVRNATSVQLAYNKLESVIRGHRLALRKKNTQKAAHAYGPNQNATFQPVLAIGASNIIDVLIDMEAKFDALDIPQEDRIALLCPAHKAALKKADKVLFKDVFGQNGSKNLYSFEVFSTSVTPTYNAGVKNAFGAAPAAGDVPSSLFYSAQEVMRADGEYDMYSRLKDPEARGDIIGFQKRFVALPIRNIANGAIIG